MFKINFTGHPNAPRGYGPGSAFIVLRWFNLAHICIHASTIHNVGKEGIDGHIFWTGNRFHVKIRIPSPKILFKQMASACLFRSARVFSQLINIKLLSHIYPYPCHSFRRDTSDKGPWASEGGAGLAKAPSGFWNLIFSSHLFSRKMFFS